ncbi:MAG: hypothetical protein ACM3Z4_01395, partial [Hyphomicrobiales bacterium]
MVDIDQGRAGWRVEVERSGTSFGRLQTRIHLPPFFSPLCVNRNISVSLRLKRRRVHSKSIRKVAYCAQFSTFKGRQHEGSLASEDKTKPDWF